MLEIQQYDSILDPVYGTFTAKINGLISSAYLRNAAEYTGMSAADAYLRSALAENMANTESVKAGLALVETNQGYIASIGQKLDEMKTLVDDAAGGGHTSEELADMQGQIEALAEEIDDIAEGKLGEVHILTADGLMERVFIGNGLSIDIQSQDMTAAGLDLDSVSVVDDPTAALTKIDAALKEYNEYGAYLDGRRESLQVADSALETQRAGLFAVESAIESTDAALMVVGLVDAQAHSITDILMIAQANTTAQTVLTLLAD